ncbi:MAG: motility associated factor glycosyltransferase family protein [Firmicutes bacterium]|nr:motility associated factor glycosyltransferase family protein [Bacillota bacterium]
MEENKKLTPSNQVLAANIAVLERNHPHISQIIAKSSGCIPDNRVQITSSKSGQPTLLYYHDHTPIHLHSTYNPVEEAQRWAESLSENDWQTAIVFGFGLGYHIEALSKKYPKRRLIVLEPDSQILSSCLSIRDLTTLLSNPQISLIVSPESPENPKHIASQVFSEIIADLSSPPALFPWPTSARIYSHYWEEIQEHILGLVRSYRANIATHFIFAHNWLRNFFINLPTSITDPGINKLFGSFPAHPAILVAAGPSLERNVDLLKSIQGAALIVAAGSAINPLRKHQIEPDLLVSMDPGEDNYRHFANLVTDSIPLVYPSTLFHRIVKDYKGPRFVINLDTHPFDPWIFGRLDEDKGLVSSGPSVANTTLDILRKLGCNPIIFVGQDLAYTDDKSHAEGAIHAHEVHVSQENKDHYRYTDSIDGTPVLTDVPLLSMKHWFERYIAATKNDGTLYIDATEGGARIAGTKLMSLHQAIEEYCQQKFNFYKVISDCHQQETANIDVNKKLSDLKIVLSDVNKQLDQVGGIYRRANEITKHLQIESLAGSSNLQRYKEASAKLRNLDQELTKLEVYQVFIKPSVYHITEITNRILVKNLQRTKDPVKKSAYLAKTYQQFFEAAFQTSNLIKELITSIS